MFKNPPGRLRIIKKRVFGRHLTFILDGAHTPEAARALSKTFSLSGWARKSHAFLIGMLDDCDHPGILKSLGPHLGRVVVTPAAQAQQGLPLPNISGRRSAPAPAGSAMNIYSIADDIAGIRPDADVEVQSDLNAALCSVSRGRDVVVVTGSSRLVEDVLKAEL